MAEIDKTNAGLKLGKARKSCGEATKTKEESKDASPAREKSVNSDDDDTRESAASTVCFEGIILSDDAKEKKHAPSVYWEGEELPPFLKRQKRYPEDSIEADKQLWNDILLEDKKRGGSFLDKKFLKYILIDVETREAFVEVPSIFHEAVVRAVRRCADDQANDGVMVEASGVMKVKEGGKKHPDIFIFGMDRTTDEDGFLDVGTNHAGYDKNPSAIIEVSWTNRLEEELKRFELEMNECNGDDLGTVNVGYLIKFVPNGLFPTEENRDCPLLGIDVYRMKAHQAEPTEPLHQWRFGQAYPPDLKITGEELGQDNGTGISIPFKTLVGALAKKRVFFDETKNKEGE